MDPSEFVLVDTCIWIPFFNRPDSPEKRAVDDLLDEDRAALIGPVVTEILQGFRRDAHADWVASNLHGLRYVDLSWRDWTEAAKTGRRLAANGRRLPLADLLLAAVALRTGCSIFSTDPHFDIIPGLSRFRPVNR